MEPVKTRFGRTKGGSWAALFLGSLAVGLALAGVVAAVVMTTIGAERPGVYGAVFASFVFPVGVALGWVLLVDRSSLTGALARPQDSVEDRWLNQAMAGAFLDLIAVAGVLAAILTITGTVWNAAPVVATLILLGFADVGVRYWLGQRRES